MIYTNHTKMNPEELKRHFKYDPETGLLWRRWKSGLKQTGLGGSRDYLHVKFKGKVLLLHRIAWAIEKGVSNDKVIDHINGNTKDNRLFNLRESTETQNQFNRKANSNSRSGIKGVSWKSSENKWRAQIRVDGKKVYLGCFETKEEAAQAYQAKAKELHGEFYREATR